jgi:crossover junction endodeoxyribonuclease RuvC
MQLFLMFFPYNIIEIKLQIKQFEYKNRFIFLPKKVIVLYSEYMFGVEQKLIILGIDPGIAILGYGLVNYEANKFSVIDYGAVTTEAGIPMSQRLTLIYDSLIDIFDKYKPDVFAIEELFFNKNIKTALTVGHARGVAVLAGTKYGIPVYEYTPLQVKQAVVGYGRAEKKQIQQMVKILLNLREIPKPDDVADALAVAICHGNSSNFSELFKF